MMATARQLNLFGEALIHQLGDQTGHYPITPGYKRPGASADAARAIARTAAGLRGRVLRHLQQYSAGLTADEIARGLELSILTIRPRVSELRAAGAIRETGERRRNESRMTAMVWTIAAEPRR
jgi:hypothetical protein